MKYSVLLALAGALSFSVMAAPIELPPEPKYKLPPSPTWWAKGTTLPAYVIQTSTGPVECPDRFYDPAACRPYVQGKDKRMRVFVRKEGEWMICPRPKGREGCVGMRQTPNWVEQD
ncbi:hypothetical protein [Azohydromonas australica]|uniref:hypothetical protein n=1 Tax=Azohydromonas australica TaxID=364039 RepID=UPI000419B5DA|nr:hypothetical protein [Azohydromonas australica]